jgi:serine/threonine protein kinase
MGEVYQARDTRLNRLVALKVLSTGRAAVPERRQRFVQEAQLASSLEHPNIVITYEIGASDGTDFIAMELVRGRTLEALIPRGGMRLNEALKIAVQAADALTAAHAAGVVHRDLKPSNIISAEGFWWCRASARQRRAVLARTPARNFASTSEACPTWFGIDSNGQSPTGPN